MHQRCKEVVWGVKAMPLNPGCILLSKAVKKIYDGGQTVSLRCKPGICHFLSFTFGNLCNTNEMSWGKRKCKEDAFVSLAALCYTRFALAQFPPGHFILYISTLALQEACAAKKLNTLWNGVEVVFAASLHLHPLHRKCTHYLHTISFSFSFFAPSVHNLYTEGVSGALGEWNGTGVYCIEKS